MSIESVLAVANFVFCLQRLISTFKARRLSAAVWALAAYFSFFFIFVATGGPFIKHRGFTGETLYVRQQTIDFASYYVAAFHVIFALTEVIVWKLLGGSAWRVAWEFPNSQKRLAVIRAVFFCFLGIGGALYWWKMRNLGYREYVEGVGSNWPMVFLWASTPLITISMMQRRYWTAALAGVPFILFAFMLNVRSFILLSLVPAVIVGQFHLWQRYQANGRLWGSIIKGGALVAGLLLASIFIMQQKGGEISLPDSGMVYGTPAIMEAVREAKHYTGFNSLMIYGLNLINPFLKVFGIDRPHLIDTPVYMASLIDGVPKDWPIYYHYPTLWYSDAFISFGINGLSLAAFWALILTIWEAIMWRYPAMIALMLPYYVWHVYMLVRGSTGIASVPFAYAFYISAIVYLLLGGRFVWMVPPKKVLYDLPSSDTVQTAH